MKGPATEALRRYAERLTNRIVTIAGSDGVTAVFAGGSLANNSVAWFDEDDLEILSDVDLYVVAADGRLDDVRRAAAGALAEVAPDPGVRLMRPTDVGVVTMGNLLAEPARPGTVDLPDIHVLLHGDASIFAAMAEAMGTEIDPSEGLYLIENRLSEMPVVATALDDPSSERLRRYQLLKTILDVVSGYLVASGRYRASPDGRLDAAGELGGEEGLPPGWDEGLVRKAAEGRADLIRYLGESSDEGIDDHDVREFAIDVWAGSARRVYGDADMATLVLKRCRVGEYRRNFREFLAMSSRWGGTRSRRAWTAVHLSRYSPLSALRLGALVDALLERDDIDEVGKRSLGGVQSYLERLTEVCGHAEGGLGNRVRAAHKTAQSG